MLASDVTTSPATGRELPGGVPAIEREAAAARHAFWILRLGFTAAPILFGVDKFFNWSVYIPGTGQDWMHVVGVVEIAAGVLVLVAPRIGAFVVAAWLAGIIVNLLTKNPPEYYDIALRDFGLMLAALTLGRLSLAVVPARKARAPMPM
jgi:uncharacterized membrane protein YphA (DoxX/SURF4 family)